MNRAQEALAEYELRRAAKHEVTPQFKAVGTDVVLTNADGEEGNTLQIAKCSFPADAEFVARACDAHDDLVVELRAAGRVISAMLNCMTDEQKRDVAVKLAAQGVITDGLARANEREAVLSKVDLAAALATASA